MSTTPLIAALNQICDEKGLDRETVLGTVEAALAAAYRKDYGTPNQHIRAHFNEETGEMTFEDVKTVVVDEELENEEAELTLEVAKAKDAVAEIGTELVTPLPVHDDFGRIAAQTAKQVIIQRIREAEKNMLFDEYKEKEHQIVPGFVQNMEGRNIIVNIGRISGIMFPGEQVPTEHYYVGQRMRIYVKEVVDSGRGPQVVVSRSAAELIAGLFIMEVPEIETGAVEIKAVAREAGSRTKIAVHSTQEGLDPVGSCVGQRGARVQAVLAEVGDEKIDIVLWNDDSKRFIMNALSPAKIDGVELNEQTRRAAVSVPADQLSLAIGKGGQNVRLASRLVGWDIDILREGESRQERQDRRTSERDTETSAEDVMTEADQPGTPEEAKMETTDQELTETGQMEPAEPEAITTNTEIEPVAETTEV